jgi:ribose transport system permease protein
VFTYMGFCAAIAAVIATARAASAQITAGDGMEMDAIAAAVIGGTPLMGGKANIVGAFFGCLLVGVVSNGLNLLGVNANWQIVAKGALIMAAIVLDSVTSRVFARIADSSARLS